MELVRARVFVRWFALFACVLTEAVLAKADAEAEVEAEAETWVDVGPSGRPAGNPMGEGGIGLERDLDEPVPGCSCSLPPPPLY